MSVFIGYPSFMAYQMMKGKKDNNDGFPSIPGMIARYSALGLTNEEMSKNPVWVDKTGNGHDLQMKNFLWDGMSGVGGYNQNFNQWGYGNLPPALQTYTPHKMELNIPSTLRIGNVYSNLGKEGDIYDFTLKIVGLKDGASLRITKGVVSGNIERIEKGGIYKIYQPLETSWDQLRIYIVIGNPNLVDLNITIEQLPLYPGALVFDGVDDYGICDNFPILTKEKGYTVVALRQYLINTPTAYLTANGDSIENSSFIMEGNKLTDTWNFGKPTTIQASRILATQTSKQYDGVNLNIGTNTESSNLLLVSKWNVRYSKVVIWELVFLDHDATEEELTKIKDYFIKTYPWLFFDQAWTVVGKTNEDEDRATIANITGNGNDLILSNFGFAEGSGYGLYFFGSFHSDLGTNINYTHIGFSQITLHNIKTEISGVDAFVKSISAGQKIDYTIKISGLTALNEANPGFRLTNSQSRAGLALDVSSDGIYHIQGTVQESDYTYVTCTLAHDNGNIPTDLDLNVTIEQIPEYEGYLVTDGVDDKIDSSAFEMGEDFTVVGEWKLLPVSSLSYSGMLKNDNLYLYNNASTGLRVYIRSTDARNDMEGLKSLKAICSDGRVYGEDWTEYKLSIGSTIGSQSRLYLGYNNTAYTKMIFKNLGIYNNQILSKEDCIKAYNYLQTLKAK